MPTRVGYWAIHSGPEGSRGVYSSWKECRAQTRGYDGAISWHRFPLSKRGLADAKAFCVGGVETLDGATAEPDGGGGSDSDSGDSSDSDSGDPDDPSVQVVVLQTNWTKQLAAAAADPARRRPQFAVVFGHDQEDPRNLYSLYRLPRPTTDRCILMALLALMQWCEDPMSAVTRREHDPYAKYEVAATPGLAPEVRVLVVQTPCASVERLFGLGPPPRRAVAGLAQSITRILDRLRAAPRNLDVRFVTIAQDTSR